MFHSQERLPKWCQHFVKIVNHFLSNTTKFCMVQTIRFCSNSTSMWSKYLSNNVLRDFRFPDFQCPIGKSIFAVNLPLKLFPATIANADIRNLKSPINSFENVCTICQWNLNKIIWSKLHKILSFLTKNQVFITIFDKELMPFWKTFL